MQGRPPRLEAEVNKAILFRPRCTSPRWSAGAVVLAARCRASPPASQLLMECAWIRWLWRVATLDEPGVLSLLIG